MWLLIGIQYTVCVTDYAQGLYLVPQKMYGLVCTCDSMEDMWFQ